MTDIVRLKEQARGHEDDARWEAALAIYERLVTESATEEIGLWNRVGDLRLRTGDRAGALRAYEHAAESYAEHGLLDNAIAVCHKLQRLAPERTSVYRTLGRLSAAHGFLADARLYVLTYAERMQAAGQREQALAALREFAELAPEDPQIRQALAEQLRPQDQEPAADVAPEPRPGQGDGEEAARVEVESDARESRAPRAAAPLGAGAPFQVREEPAAARSFAEAEANPGALSPRPAAGRGREEALPLAPSPRVEAPDRVLPVEGLESTHAERQWYTRSAQEQDEATRADSERDPLQPRAASADAPPLPEEDEDEEDTSEPLPVLGTFEEAGTARGAGHYERGLALRSIGRFEDAIAEFQAALRHGVSPLPALEAVGECFVQKGQHSLAVRVLERGLGTAGAEEHELIGILYWLGRCQQALGRADLARDYLERVLALDIRFRDAAARLEALEAAAEP